MKILIVDDELVSRKKMLKIVETLGDCHTVESGEEAMEYLGVNPDIDLILLDIIMPGLDGYEVYSKLKENDLTKNIPVIFVTSLDEEENKTKGFEIGGLDYITKPFEPNVVLARVRNRLNMIKARKRQKESARSEKILSVGSLAIGMAHEINNPLAGMMQNAQVLMNRLTRDVPVNEEVAQRAGTSMHAIKTYMTERGIINQLRRINEAGIQAAAILKKVLDVAEDSQDVMMPENILEMLNEATELVKQDRQVVVESDFEKIEIVKDHDDHLPEIICDRSKVKQVFYSVIKNAVQAMMSNDTITDGAKLTLTVKKTQHNLLIEIMDNGCGMDEETSKQIFDYLYTTREAGKGTGLELAIAYLTIVEIHRGFLDVISEPGKGSKIIIGLPIR